MSESTQINVSTTTEIVNVDVTETLQPVSLECFFANGSAQDTVVNVSENVLNIDLDVTETQAQNVTVDIVYPAGPQGPAGVNEWGTISGTLSTQTDLWSYLSAVGTSNFDIATLNNYLSTNNILLCSLNVNGQILSAGTDLFDIFLTSETDSQTLSYIPSSYLLSISNGNTVNLSSINSTFAANSAKYESVYSNVQSNSADWSQAYNTATVYQTNSATYAPKVELRSYYIYSSGDYAVQQGRNVELSFSAPAAGTNITITLPRQDSNDNAQSGDELLIRLLNGVSNYSTVTIRQYTYTGSLPYLGTFTNLVTFPANTPSQTIRLRLSGSVWSLLLTPNLFSPSPIGNITPNTGSFTTLSATGIVYTNNDIEITNYTKGIILRSPNGNRWRTTITNSGTLSSVQI